jgi:hypothetical protein
MFFELRQYKMQPGKQKEFAEFMDTVVVPFQRAKGMVILGNFIGETDESIYVWIRRFADEAERERLYKAVYESDEWKTDIAPKLPDLMDRSGIVVTRLEATPKSVIQ